VSPAKTAEPIEMPFGAWIPVDPRNIALDGVQIFPRERVLLMGITSVFSRVLSTSVPIGQPQKQSGATLNFLNENPPFDAASRRNYLTTCFSLSGFFAVDQAGH